jgi:lipid-binding SYLF domain-containing protein
MLGVFRMVAIMRHAISSDRNESTRIPAMKTLLATLLFVAAATQIQPAWASAREEARLIESSGVLEELFAQRDTAIPERLMARAHGIVVVPNVVKVAAVVGGRHGAGVMVVRDASGNFSDPIMVTLSGGNVGWQIGVQSTDIVLVFTTARGIKGITDGKLTLGADASVAAGPVGRAASAATDQNFTAEVYSYSRNRGLFAGVALDGSVLAIDSKANRGLYGKTAPATDIIAGTVTTNADAAQRFERAILASTAGRGVAPASASHVAPAATEPATGAVIDTREPSDASGADSSFPKEDSQPGAEPPR